MPVCISSTLFAQFKDTSELKKRNKHIYLELLGNSISWALHYERPIYSTKKTTLALSAGIGPSIDGGTPAFFDFREPCFPFEVKMFTGSSNSHKFELGLSSNFILGYYLKDNRRYEQTKISLDHFYFNSRIGYRYNAKKGFVFRIALTPLAAYYWGDWDYYFLYGGLSFGYAF
jgi:hypothetical protein